MEYPVGVRRTWSETGFFTDLHMRRLTHNLHRRDLRSKDEDGAGDQEDVLEDTRKREDEAAARADEEHGGDVQQERDERVRE